MQEKLTQSYYLQKVAAGVFTVWLTCRANIRKHLKGRQIYCECDTAKGNKYFLKPLLEQDNVTFGTYKMQNNVRFLINH